MTVVNMVDGKIMNEVNLREVRQLVYADKGVNCGKERRIEVFSESMKSLEIEL